ncbi:gamma-glutamyltransferase [Rhizorhapis suberifaciens]|uniref:Glutathione hydrolase proenzyme n=1 Tax=Rhizorhapis suberifaciens TaxID=13656 RepID=A0A840HUZ1_9SPHN|nr:gamma-glutamyltransferase [Rhizorhapis suberifaciens]MBB4641399.1 gamma-glutamyltranspeptidase/glutathione hydrolase [Rhizorhapis suberifaciens]
MLKFLLSFFLIIAVPVLPARAEGGSVSSADPRATAAGQEILRKGGSATDAALAMLVALTVVEPQSSGIGGGGFLIHHDGRLGLLDTIDGRETAPSAAGPGRFLGTDGKPLPFIRAFPGGLSVGVPGNLRLMEMAHRKWGKLPWTDLFQPAIRLAEEGFEVNQILYSRLTATAPLWKDFPDAQAIYWREGKPVPVGTVIRNPALAAFLKRLATEGPSAFYSGANAQAITNALARAPINPAVMTPEDLTAYQAKQRPALCSHYRIYVVCGMGPPSSGAIAIIQMLGMLERFDMAKLGADNPKSWHLIGEAMRLAYADRDKYLGDRDFVEVPVAGLIDPNYLLRRSKLISADHARKNYEPGTPAGAVKRTPAPSSEVPATSHFVAADGNGNIVTMTSTIEGAFGSQLIANGYFLNNELTDFSFAPEKDGAPVANRVEAGKRPLSSMSPTIVYDANGKPILALGSAGGKRIIMHVLKTLVGVLDFGLPVETAIALPNIFFNDEGLLVEQDSSVAAMIPALEKLGQKVQATVVTSKVNAVQRAANGWTGAADPRSPGVALAE